MKTKHVTIIEDISNTQTLRKIVNLKNREKLRKKLKILLDKQQKINENVPATDTKIVYTVPKIAYNSQKQNSDENLLNQATTSKSEIPKKIKPIKNKSSSNEKPKTILKRKSNGKSQLTKKPSKLPKIASTTKTTSASKITSTSKITSASKITSITQSKSDVAQNVKPLPDKIKTSKTKRPIINKKVPKVQSKNKVKSRTKQNTKLKRPIKKSKELVNNVKQYRGPLRLDSSSSESDDKLISMQKMEHVGVKKVPGYEQALTRVAHADQISHDGSHEYLDDSYYSQDEDYNSSDDEYTSNTDDDSSYDDDSDHSSSTSVLEDCYYYNSQSDSSYNPPKNILEDVYIANGTAIKHELSEANEVFFDSDTSSAQIIEIDNASKPEQAATHSAISLTPKDHANDMEYESEDSCPELVSMDNNMNLIDDDADADFCYDCSSCSGIDSDIDTESSECSEASQMIPEIFHADKPTKHEDMFFHVANGPSKNYALGSPLDRIMNSKSDTALYKVITTNNRIVNSDAAVKRKSETNIPHVKKALLNNIENSPNVAIQPSKEINENTKKSPSNHNIEPTSLNATPINKPAELVAKTSAQDTTQPTFQTFYGIFTTNNQIVADSEAEVTSESEIKIPHTQEALLNNIKYSPNVAIQPSGEINEKSKKSPSNHNIEPVWLNATSINKPTESVVKTQSTFRTLFFNAVNSNQVIALLKHPLYIYGTVKLKLIAGSLEIFGYNPKRNEVLEIFSPRGYSSLKIDISRNSAVNVAFNKRDLLSLTPYFIRTDLEEIAEKFNPNRDAIVVLERNDRSKKVAMLKKYMVEHLFPNMNSLHSDRPFYTSEFLLRCVLTPTSDKALILDNKWKYITVNEDSKVMVIGGKSVGKSTLVRYLINKNLNKYPKMLLIDLDIGQPEMFVPQTISVTTLTAPLLGPGYFLNKEPDKAYLIGHTNVVFSPHRYIENVNVLISYCENMEEYKNIPWIVNTMGYNKGFGDELIAVISSFLHPTNIIQLDSDREINNFDIIMSKENMESFKCSIIGDMTSTSSMYQPEHNLTLMTSVIPNYRKHQKDWDMNPRDMRLAMIVSRLSAILTGHAEWLTDIKPVCASINDLKIINLGDDNISKEDLLQTLVGNLVYLCRQECSTVNECIGIGIVRGIDYPLKQIYLLPAIPLDMLEKVNCLAVCEIPLPSSILINQGPKVKGVASYIYNTIDKPASMYIKQIYHRPQHFLTGKHKPVVE